MANADCVDWFIDFARAHETAHAAAPNGSPSPAAAIAGAASAT
jgi:hypothetical protein